MIQVTIGGEKKAIAKDITIARLLEQENVEMPEYVSV